MTFLLDLLAKISPITEVQRELPRWWTLVDTCRMVGSKYERDSSLAKYKHLSFFTSRATIDAKLIIPQAIPSSFPVLF